jgi:hypothetical protein
LIVAGALLGAGGLHRMAHRPQAATQSTLQARNLRQR